MALGVATAAKGCFEVAASHSLAAASLVPPSHRGKFHHLARVQVQGGWRRSGARSARSVDISATVWMVVSITSRVDGLFTDELGSR